MEVHQGKQLLEKSSLICVLLAKPNVTKAPFKRDPEMKDLWSHCLVPGVEKGLPQTRARCRLPPAAAEVAPLLLRKGNLSLRKPCYLFGRIY